MPKEAEITKPEAETMMKPEAENMMPMEQAAAHLLTPAKRHASFHRTTSAEGADLNSDITPEATRPTSRARSEDGVPPTKQISQGAV